jgi:MFS family permease
MVALVAVVACGLALTQPTLSALTPDMVGRANLPRASAIGQAASAIGTLTGPVLGGVLVGAFGVRPPLFADAASFLLLAVAGLLIRTRRGGRARPASAAANAATNTGTGWRLGEDRLLVSLIAAFGAVIAAISAVNVAELFFVRETLGGSTTVYGIVVSGWTAGMLVFAWPWARIKGDDRRLVLIELYLLAGVTAVVTASSAVPAPLWLLPMYLLGGGLNVGLNVIAGTVVGRRVPGPVRGRVFGVFATVSSAANLLGYAAGGLLLGSVPARLIMFGTGVAGLIVSGAFLASVLRSGRVVPAAPAGPDRVAPAASAEVAPPVPAPVG